MSTEQLKKKRRTKSREDKKKYYVNGSEFRQAITDYYATDSEDLPDQLAIYIKKIADGLSYAPNFINYSYKEDMVGDAIVKMLSALRSRKFDINSESNPFSYFTTIAFHAFINRIKKEKKHREMVSEYQEMVYEELLQSDVGEKITYRGSGNSDEEE